MNELKVPHNKMLNAIVVMMLGLNIVLWSSVRDVQPKWLNVPPAPSVFGAATPALGDRQFAYRLNGLKIQNFGDTGGRITSLMDYNVEALSSWFHLEHNLDPQSNFIPNLAGFFFAINKKTENLGPIVDYLEVAGQVEAPQKWRWLAQASHIARFKMNDTDRALEIAKTLAAMDSPDMPSWTKQMPAFILNSQGDKESALALMLEILKTESETMHPSDVNATTAYICEQILEADEAAQYELCQKDY